MNHLTSSTQEKLAEIKAILISSFYKNLSNEDRKVLLDFTREVTDQYDIVIYESDITNEEKELIIIQLRIQDFQHIMSQLGIYNIIFCINCNKKWYDII